ncbi:hypothetical protein R3P38DRAFT_2793500 [Favolaschia claudopus]|uniref:Uncharacterized protein n=1 Tax=Favolaschia claudopus TaxID=2862362 RepID=A0AAW0AD33_9AGAR
MSEALKQAVRCGSRTARDDYLKQFGLHNFAHFLWKFAHSEPYKAVGYDCLHYFDGGIWGRHVWVLFKQYLQDHELAETFNKYMDQFPRWRNLKHLSSATKIDYSEGQTFVDILIDKSRRGKHSNEGDEPKYEHARRRRLPAGSQCTVPKDEWKECRASGMSIVSLDCSQISVLDENEETMARLDMEVHAWQESQRLESEFKSIPAAVAGQERHWKLGSADSRLQPRRLERLNQGNSLYRNFEMRLSTPVHREEDIESRVNWKSERDILRCNPKFHGRPRYDSVIFSAENDELAMGELGYINLGGYGRDGFCHFFEYFILARGEHINYYFEYLIHGLERRILPLASEDYPPEEANVVPCCGIAIASEDGRSHHVHSALTSSTTSPGTIILNATNSSFNRIAVCASLFLWARDVNPAGLI